MTQRIGLYPGTFDPITKGHVDIITRALKVVDRLVVAVASNDGKGPLFSVGERVALVQEELARLPDIRGHVDVRPFDTLLIHFAQSVKASVIIRGLRAVSDFEYEFQMSAMNRRLDPALETVFLAASEAHQFISSRFVKEIARLGGDVSPLVPDSVAKKLADRFGSPQDRPF